MQRSKGCCPSSKEGILQTKEAWLVMYPPMNPSIWAEKQKYQEFKIIFGYTGELQATWAT